MRSRYQVLSPHHAHFVMCTTVEWLPVFNTAACCDILVQSLEYCRIQKGLLTHAWAILDTHWHAILRAPDLPGTLRDLKAFTARALLAQTAAEGPGWLLNQLAYHRQAHKGQTHQVWQEGSHPQAILSDAIMEQKLEGLPGNPVKRGLVSSPEHWQYSSAYAWQGGVVPVLRCDEWR